MTDFVINPKAKYYLTNADLLPEVIICKGTGVISKRLAQMLLLLSDRYSRKFNFNGYTFREDMVSAAVLNLMQNALKFNPEASSNPFAYYTQAIHRSFLQYIEMESKHRHIRDQLLVDCGMEASHGYRGHDYNSDNGDYFDVSSKTEPDSSNKDRQ